MAVMPVAVTVVVPVVTVVMTVTVVVVMTVMVMVAVMTVHMAVVTVHTVTAAAVHHMPTAAAMAAAVTATMTAGVRGRGGESRHGDSDCCSDGEDCSALEHFRRFLWFLGRDHPRVRAPVSLKARSAAVLAITQLANAVWNPGAQLCARRRDRT